MILLSAILVDALEQIGHLTEPLGRVLILSCLESAPLNFLYENN